MTLLGVSKGLKTKMECIWQLNGYKRIQWQQNAYLLAAIEPPAVFDNIGSLESQLQL